MSNPVLILPTIREQLLSKFLVIKILLSRLLSLISLYIRLYRNNCDVPSALKAINLLSIIFHLQYFVSIFLLFSHMFISNLTWNVKCSAIQTESSRQTDTTNTISYSSVPYMKELKVVNLNYSISISFIFLFSDLVLVLV